MTSKANTPEAYIDALPEERQEAMRKLRNTIRQNLPEGFEEIMNGMIGYVVPFSLYPQGYHCPPRQPLPFLSIASQKNYLALYHFGLYSDPDLLRWFKEEYPKHSRRRLDMGKSCVRFKKTDDIPYELIAQLAAKMSPHEWIAIYEKSIKK